LGGGRHDLSVFSHVDSFRRHRRDYNVVYSVVIIGDKVNVFVSTIVDAPATDAPVTPAVVG
jgi:hypothetical protein